MQKTNKKGFTLIELLVVISIIGLLSTLAVVSLGSARQKARDAKRKSDIKNISTAMELYSANSSIGAYYAVVNADCTNAAVPIAEGDTDGEVCEGNALADSTDTYLQAFPADPTDATTPYTYTGDADNYCFRASLENNDGTNVFFSCTTGGVCGETATDC